MPEKTQRPTFFHSTKVTITVAKPIDVPITSLVIPLENKAGSSEKANKAAINAGPINWKN